VQLVLTQVDRTPHLLVGAPIRKDRSAVHR
jgi:hypothetical protein